MIFLYNFDFATVLHSRHFVNSYLTTFYVQSSTLISSLLFPFFSSLPFPLFYSLPFPLFYSLSFLFPPLSSFLLSTPLLQQRHHLILHLIIPLQIVQKLYPQCQKCFSLQGNAVRLNQHVLIHHYKLKVHHFSPLIVYFLMQNSQFLEFLDFCAPENIVEIIKSFK